MTSFVLVPLLVEIKTEVVSTNIQVKTLVGKYKKMKREGMVLTKNKLAP